MDKVNPPLSQLHRELTRQRLAMARDLVTAGWTQGYYFAIGEHHTRPDRLTAVPQHAMRTIEEAASAPGACFCSAGAVAMAVHKAHALVRGGCFGTSAYEKQLLLEVAKAVPQTEELPVDSENCLRIVLKFNDAIGRTKAEVVHVFDKAVENYCQ